MVADNRSMIAAASTVPGSAIAVMTLWRRRTRAQQNGMRFVYCGRIQMSSSTFTEVVRVWPPAASFTM